MKEVNYSRYAPTTILHSGTYDGFDFKIVNYGDHPCSYVRLPENHKYYGVQYSNIDIMVHGGITYSEIEDDGFWIGWDYGQFTDYKGVLGEMNLMLGTPYNAKKWTTEEIWEHTKDVIHQLKGDTYESKQTQNQIKKTI